MVEDRTLEGLQVRARVEPELFAEGLAGGVVGAQRVRLPTGPVQGQDQLLTEAFAQRHLADEVRQDPGRFAVATQPEQQIHPTFDRDPAELFEPGDLAPDELVIRDVLQRSAPPQPERGIRLVEGRVQRLGRFRWWTGR